MQTPAATPVRCGNSRRVQWLVFLVLVLAAIAWRMPFAATRPVEKVDEVRYTMPTVQRFLAGDPVAYIAGTNYAAPAEQALAAGLFRVFGESASAFRFPTVLLGSLGAGIVFLAMRRFTGMGAALAVAIPLVFANSAVARYTAFSHGSYGLLMLLVAGIQLATLWTDERRTPWRWLVLGALMGGGMYALKLALFQCAASFAWLWLRSDHFLRLRAASSEPRMRGRLRAAIFAGTASAVAMMPVLYRYLTRRAEYGISSWEKVLLFMAAALAVAGGVALLPAFPRPFLGECAPLAVCCALVILIPLPAERWFRTAELPRLEARGEVPYSEAAYSLKHLHEWPGQARLLAGGVFPALFVGRWKEVRGYDEGGPDLWKTAIAVAVLVLFATAGLRRWRSEKWRFDPRSPDVLFLAPFVLVLAVLFPSWALHSESSYRYLLSFFSGLLLLGWRCVEPHAARRPGVVIAVLAAHTAYALADCIGFIS